MPLPFDAHAPLSDRQREHPMDMPRSGLGGTHTLEQFDGEVWQALAAGRLSPGEGLLFVAEVAKPNDLVSIGIGSGAELEETVKLAEKWLG